MSGGGAGGVSFSYVSLDLSQVSRYAAAATMDGNATITFNKAITPDIFARVFASVAGHDDKGISAVDGVEGSVFGMKVGVTHPTIKISYTTGGYGATKETTIKYSGNKIIIPLNAVMVLDKLGLLSSLKTALMENGADHVADLNVKAQEGGYRRKRSGSRKSGRKSRKSKRRSSKKRSSRRSRN